MDHSHIVTRFDKDLSEIESLLVEMADLVAKQISDSALALQLGDNQLAKAVTKNDSKINRLEEKIDDKAIRLIALRQPMAEDLRSAITTLKVSNCLERMGDYAKTLSYRARKVDDFSAMKSILRSITETSEKIINMLNVVMEAYVNRDLNKAYDAREADQEINDRTDALFRELLTYMMENPRNIETCTHLLFISKNLERSGDQVTNIAEQVHYLVTGNLLEE
ncbi:phosphate signaling complex protein PhoU [Amylibacter sp.]|jgi:phosphate transport system protein|nr:phosphate signaling complex protein PhoU [Rhodobacterales bacterium]MDA7739564.1 phosphate signaling complex protein PhoU [Amylibacter sp.]MDB4235734.1 phosphate signaling complex protein PhoU [bacterium]MDA8853153.1 phosphate signaling complex protein PhoU [Amylibacter sp.]MDB3882832.1 phosphate signaling complex protein PhoU [Amylibacter sp.]|tara:strand:- start:587 stop:1252 length:666 start_codon:yes stop_codon:yes gene_type:complete